jgi:2,3-bisphosphoglycerate-independent phosphoglycerate mutase
VTTISSSDRKSNSAGPSNGAFSTRNPVSPVVLCILDGWGYRHDDAHNAIRSAETPVMDALWHAYPHTLIQASGGEVGLPDDQMGNSEVGHLTIGAGRIIRQELVRIGQAVRDGSIADNPAINALADKLLTSGRTLHLIGLCSDGGVHSHVDHLGGLLHWAAGRGLKDVCIHLVTDGRDTPTQSAPRFVATIEQQIAAAGDEAAQPLAEIRVAVKIHGLTFNGKVGVAAIDHLKKRDLRISCQKDILFSLRNEL